MTEITKTALCMIESIVSLGFIIIAPFLFTGITPLILFDPIASWIAVIGAAILQSDLILRAADGVGFVW